jgi:hypothetical protein
MKTAKPRKLLIWISFMLLSFLSTCAQVADWNFNNTLTGTGSPTTAAGNASLGSTIAAGGAFNGGTVYYGEGAWPTGSIDLNAYLEFSITPTPGNTMTVSSLVMQIRRSTTGTSGAGPNTWSVRSSLDGFATDIASGTLTVNSVPATVVTLGVGFINLSSKIIFRLYGYNATVSSGGLDRFVYDDIQVGGSTVLPVTVDYFRVTPAQQSALISWKLESEGTLSSLQIEREMNGSDFQTLQSYTGAEVNNGVPSEYTDGLNNPTGLYAYRLKMVSENGEVSYSAVQSVSFGSTSGFGLRAITEPGNTGVISFRVNTQTEGNYSFSLFSMNGNKIATKSVQLGSGSQTLDMNNPPVHSGIYILLGEYGNQKISTKVLVF